MTFEAFQSLYFTQYSAVANVPANTNQGSSVWAIGNATSLLALNVQQEIEFVDAISRLATSASTVPGVNSPDVDSFCLPFGIVRIGAKAATGGVLCSTPSAVTQPVLVPVGGVVATQGGLQFTVIADTSNAAYSPSQNGYPIAIGNSSVTVTVQCSVAGSVGNVQPGTINQIFNASIAPPITGIQSVTNPLAFTSGADTETDQEMIARFTQAESTGPVATDNALNAAVLAVQPGITYSNGDGVNAAGTPTVATVTMMIGLLGTTAAAPASLITACQSALNTVRSAGVTVTALPATVSPVNVSATVHVPIGSNTTNVNAAMVSAYNAYANNIPMSPTGGTSELDFFATACILSNVPSVTKIDSLLLNGGTADVVAPFGNRIVNGTNSFSFVAP
jgi:uncharacterized phage protein gp47/JayE